MRRIVANLDAEESWARIQRPGLARSSLSRAAQKRMAAAGSLLRVFCRPGDRLWLPELIAPSRLPEFPGLPTPILETGPAKNLAPASSTLVWGATPEWRPLGSSTEIASITARANDRAYTLELAQQLECVLPGSRMLRSPAELDRHLETLKPAPWVVKAPLSAAGRARFIHYPGADPNIQARSIQRLFHQHGELLFEPWLERIDDYGLLFSVDRSGLADAPSLHRQLIGPRGEFRGIELGGNIGLAREEREAMAQIAERAAFHLARSEYRGPVGIDFWRYHHPDVGRALHRLGEINARLTFGRVARALAATLFPKIDLGDGSTTSVRLLFGTALPADSESTGSEIKPLLYPGEASEAKQTAWLETSMQSLS